MAIFRGSCDQLLFTMTMVLFPLFTLIFVKEDEFNIAFRFSYGVPLLDDEDGPEPSL